MHQKRSFHYVRKFGREHSESGLKSSFTHKVKDGVFDEKSGRVVLNRKVLDDFKCPRRERMIVMDEVGRKTKVLVRKVQGSRGREEKKNKRAMNQRKFALNLR